MVKIIGFEDYLINQNGQVFSIKTNKYLIPQKSNTGYFHYALSKKGKVRTISIHRLIGLHFIKNPNNKKFINHINGIKTDNRIENLEWVTHSENMLHANKIGLCESNMKGVKLSNSKIVLDVNTGVYYNSAKEVADLYGFKENVFRNRLNPKNECKNNTQFKFV